MAKSKKNPPKARNALVPQMYRNTKPGAHTDRKKEMRRKACRKKVQV